MIKSKDGLPRNNISIAAIMNDEQPEHLPVYVDKIRSHA